MFTVYDKRSYALSDSVKAQAPPIDDATASTANEIWLEQIFRNASIAELLRLRATSPRLKSLVDNFLETRFREKSQEKANFSTCIPLMQRGTRLTWWNGIPYINNVLDKKAWMLSSQPNVSLIVSNDYGAIFYLDKKNNLVYASGNNREGQLGFVSENESDGNVDEPQQITRLNGIAIKHIASLKGRTYFIICGGVLVCGDNSHGHLGLGHNNEISSIELAAIPKEYSVVNVFGSYCSTFFVTKTGQVLACGGNWDAQLGLGFKGGVVLVPQLINALNGIVITNIVCGASSTFFIANDGRVFACGGNCYGQLGLDFEGGNVLEPTLITALNGNAIKTAAADEFSSSFVTRNGNVYSCGLNAKGKLGLGCAGGRVVTPQWVAALKDIAIKHIGFNYGTTFFMSEDDRVFSSGENEFGLLSSGAPDGSLVPLQCFFADSPLTKLWINGLNNDAPYFITKSGVMGFGSKEISNKETLVNPGNLSQNFFNYQFDKFMRDEPIGFTRIDQDGNTQFCGEINYRDNCQYESIYFDRVFLYAAIQNSEPRAFGALLTKISTKHLEALYSILENANDGRFIVHAATYLTTDNFYQLLDLFPAATLAKQLRTICKNPDREKVSHFLVSLQRHITLRPHRSLMGLIHNYDTTAGAA